MEAGGPCWGARVRSTSTFGSSKERTVCSVPWRCAHSTQGARSLVHLYVLAGRCLPPPPQGAQGWGCARAVGLQRGGQGKGTGRQGAGPLGWAAGQWGRPFQEGPACTRSSLWGRVGCTQVEAEVLLCRLQLLSLGPERCRLGDFDESPDPLICKTVCRGPCL